MASEEIKRIMNLFESHGTDQLSYWNDGAGIMGFQTTDPDIAAIFKRRKGATLTAWSVNKRYIRVFKEKMTAAQAMQLVKKSLKTLKGIQNIQK